MGDADKGRLFRVAPPKTPYKFPKVDVSTVEGAIAALKSPNEATRYLAWEALKTFGEDAETPLAKIFESKANPRLRARALWLLGKTLDEKSELYVRKAIRDQNADIRITALRIARELDWNDHSFPEVDIANYANKPSDGPQKVRLTLAVVTALANDSAPEVRRECAIALRHFKADPKPQLWAQLAKHHDGKDRWYLEALGIGAGNDWDACIATLYRIGGFPPGNRDEGAEVEPTPAVLDIFWRSRSRKAALALGSIVRHKSVRRDDALRYLRAFDFLPDGFEKENQLTQLAFFTEGDEQKVALVSAEALNRLKGFDVSKNAAQKAALNRVLDSLKGQPQFLTLVEKFNVTDRYPDLLALAQAKPDDQVGIDAIRVLLSKGAKELLVAALEGGSGAGEEGRRRAALATATALSNSGDGAASPLLLPVVKNDKAPADIRRQAIKGAARTKPGASEVLKLAEAKAFDETFAPALAAALSTAPLDAAQQKLVATLFPAPAGKDAKPLPPLTELAKLKGNAGNGAKLFASGMTAKCNNCHIVNNQGKEVGPNLSEIGTKLSRQAMWESIIYPSAGISHNYETYTAALSDGTVFTGLLISETADAVTLRNIEAITKTIPKKSLEEPIVKQKISLMPADLAKTLSLEEMSDIVEHLMTLKKK